MPFFSIVTPTYNRAYALSRIAEAILKQDFDDYEWIIVDDGSTDDTKDIVAKLKKDNPKIKYLQQDNKGASVARNRGASEAQGEWIVYLDSDDQPLPILLSLVLEKTKNQPEKSYGIVNHIRHIVLLDVDGKIVQYKGPFVMADRQACLQDFYHWNFKVTSSGFFHKKKLFLHGIGWDEKLHFLEDWELLMQMGVKYPDRFLHIEEVGVNYVQSYGGSGEGMCSRAQYKDWGHAFEYIYKKHQNDPLMEGQDWYPHRKKKYARLQKLVDEGREPEAMYKYFPNYKPSHLTT